MNARDEGHAEGPRARPLYARVLRLQMRLGPVACAFFFEGMIGIAALLSLAGLVTWWSVLVLPGTVATLVKVNDMVFNGLVRRLRARGVARFDDVLSDMPTVTASASSLQRSDDGPSNQA